jgi:hypothetical protein
MPLLRVVLVASYFAFEGADAQDLRSRGEDPRCRCTIAMQRVATLGSENDDVSLAASSVLANGSKGQFATAATFAFSSVALYGPTGAPVGTAGRAGQGPGEFERIRYVRFTAGDSLLIMDRIRLSLFSPDARYVRTGRLPPGVQAFTFAVLPDGRVVVNNYFPTHPSFAVMSRDLTFVREFGARTASDSPMDSDAILYALAPMRDGRFAAVRRNYKFGIEVWDASGKLSQEWLEPPTWYAPWTRDDRLAGGWRGRPHPVVMGAFVDAQHRLWVTALVADAAWKPWPTGAPATGGREGMAGTPLPIGDYPKHYDTIIEVFDLSTGRSLTSQRFDEYLPWLTETGLVYGIREGPTGLLHMDVWRPTIRTRQ